MTPRAETRTVIVVAHDALRAARIERGLRDRTGWCVDVVRPSQLRSALDERPETSAVVVIGDVDTRSVLRAGARGRSRPPILALSEAPATLWSGTLRGLGLRGVLPLEATGDELVAAVRAVHAGLLAVHPDTLARAARGATALALGAPLTSREREILEMMADGVHNRTIAARLGISRHTVKFHVASILAKLGAESRTQAVARAMRHGLLAV